MWKVLGKMKIKENVINPDFKRIAFEFWFKTQALSLSEFVVSSCYGGFMRSRTSRKLTLNSRLLPRMPIRRESHTSRWWKGVCISSIPHNYKLFFSSLSPPPMHISADSQRQDQLTREIKEKVIWKHLKHFHLCDHKTKILNHILQLYVCAALVHSIVALPATAAPPFTPPSFHFQQLQNY